MTSLAIEGEKLVFRKFLMTHCRKMSKELESFVRAMNAEEQDPFTGAFGFFFRTLRDIPKYIEEESRSWLRG